MFSNLVVNWYPHPNKNIIQKFPSCIAYSRKANWERFGTDIKVQAKQIQVAFQ